MQRSYQTLNAIRPYYDVVVIGAGISGLTNAALLSKAGLSVCVLEMDARPGGYLAGFRRKDYRFDSAIHWLNQLGPDGLVTNVFDFIGKDHPTANPQKKIKRYVGTDHDYLLTDNPDNFKRALILDFPHERKGIEKFFKAAKTIGRSFHVLGRMYRSEETMSKAELIPHMLKKLKYAIPFLKYLRYAGSEGVVKGLNTFFKDEKLLKVFASEMDMLSCLVPIGWAYYGDYQLPPTGGSQVFPEWLEHATTSMGNDVFYRCKVNQVRTDNGKVVGVDVDHKGHSKTVMCEHVVAACDVETLYEKMLPSDAIPEKLKSKLREADLYSSSVTVSLALDCPAEQLGFDEEMIYLSRDEVSREEQANGDPHTNGISILAPSYRDPSMAPVGAGTLTLYVPAFFDQYDHWGTELDEFGNRKRGEEYKRIKKWYADIIIDRVAERFAPKLRDHIVYADIATPITHWRYSGNRNGSMMGARPGEANFKAKIAHYQTPVKNLILSGHWAELGGGVPVAVKAAANTALLVMQQHRPKAAKIWANYMVGKASIEDAERSGLFQQYNEAWTRDLTPAEKLQVNRVA